MLFVPHDDGNLALVQSAAWKYGVSGSSNGSFEGKEAENGVMDWVSFSVESNGNGQFAVSKAGDMLRPVFVKINRDFANHPVSDNIAVISAGISSGIRERY